MYIMNVLYQRSQRPLKANFTWFIFLKSDYRNLYTNSNSQCDALHMNYILPHDTNVSTYNRTIL